MFPIRLNRFLHIRKKLIRRFQKKRQYNILNIIIKIQYIYFILDTLPDAIDSNCSKCTEKQKNGSTKVMRYIIDNRPEDWKYLESKYDPQGNYKKSYLDEKQNV